MFRIILLFLLIALASAFSQDLQDSIAVDHLISEVQNKYAPDKRVAIFEIEIKNEDGVKKVMGKTNIADAKEELIEKIKLSNLDYHDQIDLLPTSDLNDKIYGIVNLSVANVRSKPRHPAELATQALLGTPVRVLEYDDSFFRIQTPDEYISWVDVDGIFRVTKDELDEWISSEKIIFINEFGFCYSEPSDESSRVSDLVMGNLLKFTNEEDDYFHVQFPDGREAYVKKSEAVLYNEWLKLLSADEKGITNFAKTLIGIPYLWGGTSSKGMDCSGFTKTVYHMHGIILPRDASQQVHTGELVDTENGFDKLKQGDLLFFGRKADEDNKEKITHVGIYIGNMEYIHASGRVKINSLNPEADNFSKYRLNGFIRAKRINTSIDENGISSIKNNKFYSGDF